MNDETLAEGRDKVLKEQIDDIFARACLNNEYFGIDGWYELHTPTLRKEIQELILQDRERAVLTAQIGMVEYYYQVSNNKDMDWKGLFADNRKALEYDLSKLQSPNKREDSDE